MLLSAGTRVGSYEILSALGAGGMGEVYRARDTRLDRDVAIKILPEAFAADAERVARFQREAKVLASLNHPHIAAIYGLEDAQGVTALVMELVQGEDLSQRLASGAIALDEAVPIAKQIAEALEAAHEQGIIHRDLKPANIKVRADGTVKVLDFGLAKAMEPVGGAPNISQSPTITTPAMMTGVGVILGTAAYMSPEQAKGRAADKRSDVWSFGCVLYEILTGRRAFQGDDVSDTLAAVLKGEPDWNALPSNVPHALRALIQGCLREDRRERIGDISTALFLLRQPRALTPPVLVSPPLPTLRRRAMLVVAGTLVGAAVAAAVLWRNAPSPPAVQVTRFAFALPQGLAPTLNRRAVALSPDGSRIVYAADGGLFLRSVSDFDGRAIPGTNPGTTPVFSPDGQSLAFTAGGAIKRIGIDGGTATTICQLAATPSSLTWAKDGILFSDGRTAIMRVSQNGGKPLVLVDLRNSEDLAYAPQLLPDGDTLLFGIVKRASAALGRWDASQVVVQSLKTGVRKPLIEGGSDAQYVPTGHIVYMSETTMFAVPFDLRKLAVTGGAVPVVDSVRLANTFGFGRTAHFAFSYSGTLVYVPMQPSNEQEDVVLFDRKGGAEPLKLPPGKYEFPRVSRDGRRIAFGTIAGKEAAVSIYELSGTSSPRRLTFGGNNRFPVWSADGKRVAFQSDRDGDSAMFWQAADGGPAERLTKPEPGTLHVPESWSPDGDVLLFSATKDFVSSLWTFSVRDRKATPFSDVKNLSLPPDAMFSPDGRWVAYQMGEAGATEGSTYVQPFPPTGTKYQVAPGGRPLWSHDGKELFFVPTPSRLMVVTVTATESTFTVTSPVTVPRGFGVANPLTARTFDIMPDGRIVGVVTSGQIQSGSGTAQIRVVVNWFEELKRLVPTERR